MISKNEFEYIKIKIKKLTESIKRFEGHNPIYRQHQLVQAMNPLEQAKLHQDWDAYYLAVRNSEIGKLFQEQRIAAVQNNVGRVKEIAKLAGQYQTGQVPRPKHADPKFIDYKMSRYFEMKGILAGLKASFNEYSELYDRKNNSLDGF